MNSYEIKDKKIDAAFILMRMVKALSDPAVVMKCRQVITELDPLPMTMLATREDQSSAIYKFFMHGVWRPDAQLQEMIRQQTISFEEAYDMYLSELNTELTRYKSMTAD